MTWLMLTLIQETAEKKRLTTAHDDFAVRLNAHAFFKTNDHDTGQDLVQTTFMKTWRYLVGGGKIDMMKAFLYHVLNGLIVDEYRKHKATSLDQLIESGFEPSEDTTERLYGFIDGKAAVQLIRLLPKIYRNVVRMRYVDEMTLREMSLITGQTSATISVQVHRGVEKLRILYASTSSSLSHTTPSRPTKR